MKIGRIFLTASRWSEELIIKIPLNIPRDWIGKSNVTAHFEFFFDIESEKQRIITVNYTFILNGR